MATKKKEKPRHLGRGLKSLLGPITFDQTDPEQLLSGPPATPNFLPDKELRDSLREVSVDSISPNPYQARTVWNEQELAELADSIRANGVIQPIIVRPAGEQLLEWALVENIHRTDLNPIERAKAYQNYLNTFSLTQAEAATRLGEDRSVIANYLRLLDLPDEIKQMLAERQLSMGHARAILGLPTDELRRKLANRAMAGRLSVREVERLVRKYIRGADETRTTGRSKPAHIIDLENKLSSLLNTKVSIETRKKGERGRIIIEFYSLDEFDGIAERLGLASAEQV
jgi:ParB family chromosome partitioning protein